MGIDKEVGTAKRPHDIWRLPALTLPATQIGDHWFSLQGTVCEDFELDYHRCAAPLGAGRAKNACHKYLHDLNECVTKTKMVSSHCQENI